MHAVVLSALLHEAQSSESSCEGFLVGVRRRCRGPPLYEDEEVVATERYETVVYAYSLCDSPQVVGRWTARRRVPAMPSLRDAATAKGVMLCISIDGPDVKYTCLERRGATFATVPFKLRTLGYDSNREYASFDGAAVVDDDDLAATTQKNNTAPIVDAFKKDREKLDAILAALRETQLETANLALELTKVKQVVHLDDPAATDASDARSQEEAEDKKIFVF